MNKKLKLSTLWVLVTVLLGLVSAWLIGTFFPAQVRLFSLVSLVLMVFVLAAGYAILIRLITNLLPGPIWRRYKKNEFWCNLTVLVCLVFILYVGKILNQDWLPHKLHPVSLLADAGLLMLTIFIGWTLLRPTVKKAFVLIPGTALAVVLLIAVYSILSGNDPRSRRASMKNLESLSYLTWVSTEGSSRDSTLESGVTFHDPEKAFQGLNIYCSRNLPSAFLVDMDGNVLHRWSVTINDDDTWHHVELAKNGDLFVLVKEKVFLRIDWDSNVKWFKTIRVHHDVALAGNGDIWTMVRDDAVVSIHQVPVPIINEKLAVYSPANELKEEINLYDLFGEQLSSGIITRFYRWLLHPANAWALIRNSNEASYILQARTPSDVFHSNTLEIIDRDINDVFRQGNLLICIRNLDLIGVIDRVTNKLVWSWGQGVLERPHHPTLLENGNILMFDNGTVRRYSRVLELDPTANRIVWTYEAEPKEAFFSLSRGGNQRLPNGNTLITHSDSGRAFEVTRDGEVVWEFYNPEIRAEDNQRAAIYRLMRITNPGDYPRLQGLY